jgi:hypothetical protein
MYYFFHYAKLCCAGCKNLLAQRGAIAENEHESSILISAYVHYMEREAASVKSFCSGFSKNLSILNTNHF